MEKIVPIDLISSNDNYKLRNMIRKDRRIFILFFYMILFLGVSSILVTATPLSINPNSPFKDKNNNGIDDRFERINERTVKVKKDSNRTIISSERKEGMRKDEIKFIIQILSNKTIITVEYSSKSGANREFKFIYEVLGLLEYQDVNMDEIFDSDTDILVQNYSIQYNSSIAYQNTTVDDVIVHYLQIFTLNQIFKINIVASEQFIKQNQITLIPNALKFDFIIKDFPFISNTSRIALHCSLVAETEFRLNSEEEITFGGIGGEENALSSHLTGVNGILSWNPTYLLNEQDRNCTMSIISSIEENNEYKTEFYLNYENGEYILHDPRLGIDGIYKFPISLILIYILIGIGILIVSGIGLVMSKEEYRNYLINRILYRDKELHQLTMEQVLENKIRQKIIDMILDQPGIHYRELLRLVGTSASNLTWHLEVLVNYKIIHKQLIGNYLIYYPYIEKNPFADFDPTLVKSKTTLQIYELIGDNPGIYQNKIANRMGLNHNTVKYHLDKLLEANLIFIQKKGRKKLYYISIDHDSIQENPP